MQILLILKTVAMQPAKLLLRVAHKIIIMRVYCFATLQFSLLEVMYVPIATTILLMKGDSEFRNKFFQ